MKNEKLFATYFMQDLCRRLESRFGQSVFHTPTNPTVEALFGMDFTIFLNPLAVQRDGTPKTLRREAGVLGAVQIKDCGITTDSLAWVLETKGPSNQWDRLLECGLSSPSIFLVCSLTPLAHNIFAGQANVLAETAVWPVTAIPLLGGYFVNHVIRLSLADDSFSISMEGYSDLAVPLPPPLIGEDIVDAFVGVSPSNPMWELDALIPRLYYNMLLKTTNPLDLFAAMMENLARQPALCLGRKERLIVVLKEMQEGGVLVNPASEAHANEDSPEPDV